MQELQQAIDIKFLTIQFIHNYKMLIGNAERNP